MGLRGKYLLFLIPLFFGAPIRATDAPGQPSVGGYACDPSLGQLGKGTEDSPLEITDATAAKPLPHVERAERLANQAMKRLDKMEAEALRAGDLTKWVTAQAIRNEVRASRKNSHSLSWYFDPENPDRVKRYSAKSFVADRASDLASHVETEVKMIRELSKELEVFDEGKIRFAVRVFDKTKESEKDLTFDGRILVVFPKTFTSQDYRDMRQVTGSDPAPESLYLIPSVICSSVACKVLVDKLKGATSGSMTIEEYRQAVKDGLLNTAAKHFDSDGNYIQVHMSNAYTLTGTIAYLLSTMGEIYRTDSDIVHLKKDLLFGKEDDIQWISSTMHPVEEHAGFRKDQAVVSKKEVTEVHRIGKIVDIFPDGSAHVLWEGRDVIEPFRLENLIHVNGQPDSLRAGTRVFTANKATDDKLHVGTVKGQLEDGRLIVDFDSNPTGTVNFWQRDHLLVKDHGEEAKLAGKRVRTGKKASDDRYHVGTIREVFENDRLTVAFDSGNTNTSWTLADLQMKVSDHQGFKAGARFVGQSTSDKTLFGEVLEVFEGGGMSVRFHDGDTSASWVINKFVTLLEPDRTQWKPGMRVTEKGYFTQNPKRGGVITAVAPSGRVAVKWDDAETPVTGLMGEMLSPPVSEWKGVRPGSRVGVTKDDKNWVGAAEEVHDNGEIGVRWDDEPEKIHYWSRQNLQVETKKYKHLEVGDRFVAKTKGGKLVAGDVVALFDGGNMSVKVPGTSGPWHTWYAHDGVVKYARDTRTWAVDTRVSPRGHFGSSKLRVGTVKHVGADGELRVLWDGEKEPEAQVAGELVYAAVNTHERFTKGDRVQLEAKDGTVTGTIEDVFPHGVIKVRNGDQGYIWTPEKLSRQVAHWGPFTPEISVRRAGWWNWFRRPLTVKEVFEGGGLRVEGPNGSMNLKATQVKRAGGVWHQRWLWFLDGAQGLTQRTVRFFSPGRK